MWPLGILHQVEANKERPCSHCLKGLENLTQVQLLLPSFGCFFYLPKPAPWTECFDMFRWYGSKHSKASRVLWMPLNMYCGAGVYRGALSSSLSDTIHSSSAQPKIQRELVRRICFSVGCPRLPLGVLCFQALVQSDNAIGQCNRTMDQSCWTKLECIILKGGSLCQVG